MKLENNSFSKDETNDSVLFDYFSLDHQRLGNIIIHSIQIDAKKVFDDCKAENLIKIILP